MFAVCKLSVIPVRREPSDKSEMVSQLLFGESVRIIEDQGNWVKATILFDNYEGWVDKKQLAPLDDDSAIKILPSKNFVAADLLQVAIWNNQAYPVVIGSSLPLYSDKKFFIGETEFHFEGNAIQPTPKNKSVNLDFAFMYLNAPYLWGGRSPFGIDCSGFTQNVFKLSGMVLKRDAAMQGEQGMTVSSDDIQPGDLAFFKNTEERVTHVGILLHANSIIHSSGRVRIDRFDNNGIFNEETKSYSHNLHGIKRIIA